MNIFLIGMMGSGKSAVGKALSKLLRIKSYDSDELIEEKAKISVPDIFRKKGEGAFRRLEQNAIRTLSEKDGRIISTGGGAPCFEENWKSFKKNGFVVWLKSTPSALYKRLKKDPPLRRPLLKGPLLTVQNIRKISSARERFYARADLVLDCDRLTPKEIAHKIIRKSKSMGIRL